MTLLITGCNKSEEPGSNIDVITLGVTNDEGNKITLNGLAPSQSYNGFVYSTSPDPTIETADQITTFDTNGDTISSTIIVDPQTIYYIRAYEFISTSTVTYGNEISYETGLAIGQEHEGGLIAYFFAPEDPGYVAGEQHGIIITEELLGMDISWGCEGTSIPEATGMEIGTGQSNTEAIVSSCGESGIAAKMCSELVLNGYSDWYLPSHDELKAIDANEEKIDGISHGFYFSSTQFSSSQAWAIYVFPPPSVTFPEAYGKSFGLRVMAVRNF